MTSGQVLAPGRTVGSRHATAGVLAVGLVIAGLATAPTAAAFVDSGAAHLSPVVAATVDIAFDDGESEHDLALDAGGLHPGESASGTVLVFNSGSVDTNLSMTVSDLASTDPGDGGALLGDHLRLTVASDGVVLMSGPLRDASFDDGLVTLPANGSPEAGARELEITVTLEPAAPVDVAGQRADFQLQFDSSRSSFRVSGHVNSSVGSVAPETFPIRMISVGARHTLVVDGEGGVWAWGRNDRGQLGDGSRDNRFRPVRVAISEKVASVSAGVDTSIAVTESGRVLTWGNGDVTADFSGVDTLTPTEVAGPWSGVVSVATGGYFFLVLDDDGALWSWGNNGDGRLGRTGIGGGDVPTPDRVTTQSLHDVRVKGIHASRFAAIAFTEDGTTVGWGNRLNSAGGRTFAGLPPGGVREVVLSYDTRLALMDDGRVFTSAGGGDFEPIGLTGVITVSSSDAAVESDRAFVATDGARVWAWGANAYGQLGLEPGTSTAAEPTVVDLSGWGDGPVRSVDLGWRHSVIVSPDGTFSSVGTGDEGELGTGAVTFRPGFVGAKAVAAWPGTVTPPESRPALPTPPAAPDADDETTVPVPEPDAPTPDEPAPDGADQGERPEPDVAEDGEEPAPDVVDEEGAAPEDGEEPAPGVIDEEGAAAEDIELDAPSTGATDDEAGSDTDGRHTTGPVVRSRLPRAARITYARP